MDFSQFEQEYIEDMTQRVTDSIYLRNFRMSMKELNSTLALCQHMKRICLSGCKLADPHELIINKDMNDGQGQPIGGFKNLEELNLEGIGLSEENLNILGMKILILFIQKNLRLF